VVIGPDSLTECGSGAGETGTQLESITSWARKSGARKSGVKEIRCQLRKSGKEIRCQFIILRKSGVIRKSGVGSSF
jgi:hypothetical protein